MSALEHVDELARRDDAAAAALAEVEDVQARAERTRARADELLAFRRALPVERGRRADAIARSDAAVDAATAAAAEIEAELHQAERRRKEKERASLERRLADARAAVDAAGLELERMHEAAARLEREAEQAETESRELEQEAQRVAARLATLPRLSHEATAPPHDGLDGVAEWGARVRAALLLLHAQLAEDRDAIIREANEVASVVLGESLGGATVARVRERVAQAFSP